MKKQNNHDVDDKVELAQLIAEKSEKLSKRYEAAGSFIERFMKRISAFFDRVLFDRKHGLFVSFAITLLVYLAFNQGGATAVSSFAHEIPKVKVNVNYNSEIFEVSGYDETVALTLVGDYSDVSMVNPQGDFNVELDLRGYGEGTHQIKYKVNSISNRVRATINPATATVTISTKEAKVVQLSHDFINLDKLGSQYVLSDPELSQRDVTIRASKQGLEDVAFVRALIDVANKTETFETDATVVAYNAKGEMLKNVDIIPSTVSVKVEISSPNKTVPIKPVFEGVLPDDKAVSSLTMNHEAMTIYGPQSVLDKIDEIAIPIKASEVSGDTSFVQNIVLPSGVRHGTVSKVSMDIKLAEGTSRTYKIPINYRYNVNNLSVALTDQQEPFTTIEVFGTEENLSDEQFIIDRVLVYIDLRDAEVGESQEFTLFVDYVDPKSYLYRIKPVEETKLFNIIKQ